MYMKKKPVVCSIQFYFHSLSRSIYLYLKKVCTVDMLFFYVYYWYNEILSGFYQDKNAVSAKSLFVLYSYIVKIRYIYVIILC